MFCKVNYTETQVIVSASWFGRFLRWITFKRFRPSVTFKRDFGDGCFDGRSLLCKDCSSVTVIGNLIVKPTIEAVKDGEWGDRKTWKWYFDTRGNKSDYP